MVVFGDALVLTNWQDFFEKHFLLLLIVYLFIYKDRIALFVSPSSQWFVTMMAALLDNFCSCFIT